MANRKLRMLWGVVAAVMALAGAATAIAFILFMMAPTAHANVSGQVWGIVLNLAGPVAICLAVFIVMALVVIRIARYLNDDDL